MANPNDAIRDEIIRFLYHIRCSARGPKGISVGITEIRSALIAKGIKSSQVFDNVDYLVQLGWVVKEVEQKTFVGRDGIPRNNEKTSYKISALGIDKLEAGSTFTRPERAGINITNINGVTIVGDGNTVNTNLTDLYKALDELHTAVISSHSLNEEQKLEASSDIRSLQIQLAKPKPKFELVHKIWTGIEHLKTFAEFGLLITNLTNMVNVLPQN